jgi:hypothetical protein
LRSRYKCNTCTIYPSHILCCGHGTGVRPSWLGTVFSLSTDPPEPDQISLRNMEDQEQRHVGTCTSDSEQVQKYCCMSTLSIGNELRIQLAGICLWLFFSPLDPKSRPKRTAADHRISPFLRNTCMQLRGSSRPGRYCRRHSSACSGAVVKSMPIVSLQERRIAICHYHLRCYTLV